MAKAIVFVWNGREIDDSTVKKMANILIDAGMCIPELLGAHSYDDNGLANVIVASHVGPNCTVSNIETTVEKSEAIKNAIVYMEKQFPTLRGSYIEFAVDLASTLQDNASKELYSAIHIIANAPINDRRLAKLKEANVNIIRRMYTRHKSIIDKYVS